jgi:quinol monooxygenase YgiN
MLHHIVLMKFKSEVTDDDVDRLEQMLDALPNTVIEIQTYEFGRDIVHSERSYDFALVSGFANLEAMQRYQTHPEHQKVVAHIRDICDDIRAVDFTTEYAAPDNLAEADPLGGFKIP